MPAPSGIFFPNIVPYHADGAIHEEELRRIIRWLGEKGVTGFYPNGSMGEFIRLSYEEPKRVVRIVSEEAGGRPNLAGAVEPNLDLVLEMCAYCADLGCRASRHCTTRSARRSAQPPSGCCATWPRALTRSMNTTRPPTRQWPPPARA